MWRLALRATLWVAGVLVVVGLLNLPRDVAVFFIGGLLLVLLVPCVAIVAAIAVVDAFRGFNRPLMIWSLAILVGLLLAPFSGWALDWPRDQLRLVLWSAILDLPPFGKPPEDGVLIMWEDWGWGGMNNMSVLVAARDDALTLEAAKARWSGTDCDVVALRRLRYGIFVVTTMDCELPTDR